MNGKAVFDGLNNKISYSQPKDSKHLMENIWAYI
jgi:hypothetical protein